VPSEAAFATWLAEIRRYAVARGISEATLNASLKDVQPIPRVLELDRRQPEFTQTFWRYFGNAVTDKRIVTGIEMRKKYATLLAKLEKQYNVPGRFLVAFWGLETNFGSNLGDFQVMNALATLAYDERRSEMFTEELFNALAIVEHGHITPERMKGSWAGAMGHTQFMPSTFNKHAVDGDGDGKIDVWGSVPDALTSAANYLHSLGWDGDRTWGREAKLPANFDVSLSSLDTGATDTIMPLAEWKKLGVTRADGQPLPAQDLSAALVLPQGANGPAFLLYDNYRAILKWNRSMLYAIAIGHLADRINGAGALVAQRSEDEPLRRDDVMTLQQGLIALGHLTGTADGVMGSVTRQSIRNFQKAEGLAADGYASRDLAAAVAARAASAPTPPS